jgi:glycosyltransferase involved in cell wall biosynthesis
MTTEGTYPYVLGGVSRWCDQLLRALPEFRWLVLPVTAGSLRLNPQFEVPSSVELLPEIALWSKEHLPFTLRRHHEVDVDLPARLMREILGWQAEPKTLVDCLVWCREHPDAITPSFRREESLERYLAALRPMVTQDHTELGERFPWDLQNAIELYRLLLWVARTAASPTPECELVHVTAAGWAAIPALVHQRLHGTPMLLTEHGVYVREAYMSAARSGNASAARTVQTRVARALTRAAYASADVISPVTGAHRAWERALGVPEHRIRPIPNGVHTPETTSPLPGTLTVVSVGRIDPLKDCETLLRVAAEVLTRVPEATFLHYGPVQPGEEPYARRCVDLHRRLNLGHKFRFMGSTSDPSGAMRLADVVLMTSVSEGLPLSALEAMAEARPVVATSVGGIPMCLQGCGIVAPPAAVEDLAGAVVMLLEDLPLATMLGARGRSRVERDYDEQSFVQRYRSLLAELCLSAEAAA